MVLCEFGMFFKVILKAFKATRNNFLDSHHSPTVFEVLCFNGENGKYIVQTEGDFYVDCMHVHQFVHLLHGTSASFHTGF